MPISSANTQQSESVAILLATKNGARFLRDQLQSYTIQTHAAWSLHVSDDGSSDETVCIIKDFARSVPQRATLRKGPAAGAASNFLNLLRDGSIEADYFAFSDQDDIWHPEKLERAIGMLRAQPSGQPALYCSRTNLIDEAGQHLGYSTAFNRPPGFQNALVQNVGGGNTMVFNSAARDLLRHVPADIVVAHDWMTYLVISAAGGTIFYDKTSWVKYRQHQENLVGSNLGFKATALRARMILAGQWKTWNSLNLEVLERLFDHITDENKRVLKRFVDMRTARTQRQRLCNLWKSGVYRQTTTGNIALLLAVIANKI